MTREAEETASAEILVVDDVPANLKLLTSILKKRGHRVRPAYDGRLALRSIAAKLPELILLDVRMPEMDGYEVCRRLKSDEQCRDIPVIFISALDETSDKLKGFQAGGVDFITKPFHPEEVLARVETHLALRRLQARLEKQNDQLQQEIAERRQAEEALRRSENTYRTIIENTGTALVIIEGDTLISLANTQFEKLSGYRRDEIENQKSWTEFVLKEDLEPMNEYHDLRRIDPYQAPANYEFRFVDREGNVKNVIVNIDVIPETEKSVASLLDISERRKIEEELQRARKWESIGIFVGGIAHDFNNLLQLVLSHISLAQVIMSSPDPEVQHSLQEAAGACIRAKELTQRLIALNVGPEPVMSPQFIQGLIQDAVNPALADSDVRCELDLPQDLWPVHCNPTEIKEIILSLAVNAREAMQPSGTIEVAAKNELLTSGSILTLKAGKYVHLMIKDHGKGIPEELITRVFDPYFSTKRRGTQKGMGLGLTMAYAIVKRHDGHIGLDSKVDVGTTFHVYLPAVE
ncbi:MAG: response regulator [Deltaproteobacteria bacterium]|nr:response regulator [Deltaproteobacteria bacterium]